MLFIQAAGNMPLIIYNFCEIGVMENTSRPSLLNNHKLNAKKIGFSGKN